MQRDEEVGKEAEQAELGWQLREMQGQGKVFLTQERFAGQRKSQRTGKAEESKTSTAA